MMVWHLLKIIGHRSPLCGTSRAVWNSERPSVIPVYYSMTEDSAEHPASHYRSAEGAIFSSSKCPPGAGMSCELPFGFLYTPMAPVAPESTSPTTEQQQQLPSGVICITCLAYMNLYCTVNIETGHWTCALCQCENVAPVETVNHTNSNLLVSPSIEFRQALKNPNTTTTERSAGAVQVRQQHQTVVLVLDQNLPALDAQAVGTMMQNLIQETPNRQINLGLIVFGKAVSIYQLGISSGMAAADTVRTHGGFTVDRLKGRSYLGTSMETLLTSISAQFGVSENRASSSDDKEEPKKSRMQILKERKEARLQKQQESADTNGVSSDKNSHKILPRSPWTVARERLAASEPPYRCTGEAIQCAIDLVSVAVDPSTTEGASSSVSRSDRILVFTNGCPNLGDGSVVDISDGDKAKALAAYSTVDYGKLARASEYYDLIAKAAAESGIGIDVFCTGSSELGLPAYQSLVEPSSGYVLSHDSFTTPHLQHNTRFVLRNTHMSMAQFYEVVDEDNPQVLPEQHLPSHYGTWIDGCTVDIRMSR
jgi:Sec23/Sec24 trunk domain/Sec23/Sec24 zinc finger